MLSIGPHPRHHSKGKVRKRERDLQVRNENSFTNNTNNKRNKAKYIKPVLRFLELDAAGTGVRPAAARQHQKVTDWAQQ